MDAETMKVLNEARMAVQIANENSVVVWLGILVLCELTIVYLHWIIERWSWIPRKRHQRVFNERF